MRRASAAAVVVTAVAMVAAAAPARAERLPSWLTIADTRRAPVQVIPPVAAARLAALQAEKYPAIDRYRHTTYDLRADGVVEERLVVARQFLNDEGVREAGTLALSASASTDRVTIDEAYVLLPDGRRRPFDARTVQVVAPGGDELFHDFHTVVLPFAELAPGATAVVAARIVSDSRRWPLPWSEIEQTQTGRPIERLEIELRWAPGMPAPAWRTDDGALRCQVDEGERHLRCARDAIPALPGDPEVASWSDLTPQLVLSTGTSWSELQAIERRLLSPVARDPAVLRVADRLVANAGSSAGRIEALLRFVADEVRYVGFEHGFGAVTPRPPSVTLARRFGDCKDKVALFLALAGRAGLQAYPVLVAGDWRQPHKLILPSWKYFDHVIACVRGEPGERPVCLDPTQPNLAAGTLSMQVRNAVSLALDGGAHEPAVLPRPDGPEGWTWQIEIETRNELACDGTIKETVVRRYLGPGAGNMRSVVRASNADERRRWMERLYADVMGEKTRPAFSIEGTDAPGAPLELRSVASYPGTGRLDQMSEWTDGDPWLVSIGRDFKTANRRHPYTVSGLSVNSDTIYELSCATVAPRLSGAELALETEFGALRRHYVREDRRLVVKTALTLPPQTVSADKLERFNRFVDRVLAQTGIWYSLERPAPLAGRGTP